MTIENNNKTRVRVPRSRNQSLLYAALISPAILFAVCGDKAEASQLSASAFTSYDAADASSIVAGPTALYSVSVDSIEPTQMNEGLSEVQSKTAAFNLITTSSALEADLLGDIEPVVIGPGGVLYLTDGHHTFTALEDSVWGSSDPTVYVNVIANYSNLTEAEFIALMESKNLLLPLDDGVAETVDTATGSPIPTSLTSLTSDVYRGLEYSILKNKSSKLFSWGASTPGLDKMTGFYSDFLEAAAYRGANGGLGLPYLSPYDIALATAWNLTATSTTTLPNVSGTVTAAQLPGFILSANIVNAGGISNATLANGAMDGYGTFTGVTEINAGTTSSPITIGTANVGFIMELGSDKGYSVTLDGTNTYTGGTSILAGDLIIQSDASLGAAPTETNSAFTSSLTLDSAGDPTNVLTAVQADNGIIFNSLTEGNGTLTIGTASGAGTSTFTTARPIAVGSEEATLNLNGYLVTLTGQLVSLGTADIGLGNSTGYSDLTIDDNSSNKGVLYLTVASPYFWGNLIIGGTNSPTVNVTSDLALGNTAANNTATGVDNPIGEVELNGGTLQAGASFSATDRDIFLDGSSSFDVNGYTTSWGTLTDAKRVMTIKNSSTTSAGSVTFTDFEFSSGTATLALSGGTEGETVTFTDGFVRDGNATLFITPSSTSTLGSTVKVLSGVTPTLVNGMAPAWMITDSGGSASTNPYNFLTYNSTNGYEAVTYTDSGSGATGGINTATSASIVDQTGAATLTKNVAAYALKVNYGDVITATGYTITLGDGTDAAGLILGGGSAAITGGTLAFGGSEAVIYAKGTSTISAAITGSNGLTLSGSGTLIVSAVASMSGAINVESGTLSLTTANVFASDVAGLTLGDVKSNPSNSILALTANQTFTTLNSVGSKSAITIGSGDTLTIGDTTNNLSSTLSSTITNTSSTAPAIVTAGSGLVDLSGATLTLVAGSSIDVTGGELRVATGALTNTATAGSAPNFVLSNGAELQFEQGGGGQYAGAITGNGELHLLSGTLQLTGTSNTYSGGTVLETGSTLDVTTATLSSTNQNITDAGGLVVFDQATNGTYTGVISDGDEMGTTTLLSGSLDKDDSTGADSGNVTLEYAQTFTGATYIEAGTLTLGAVDTLADSSGVTLGRVGGGSIATLALGANNTIQALSSDASNETYVTLGSNTLTIDTASGATSSFGGVISGTGSVVVEGAGEQDFTGVNTYTGGTTVSSGTLGVSGSGTLGATTGALAVSGGTLDLGGSTQTTGALTLTGGTIQNGALDASSFNVQSGTVSAALGGSGALDKTGSGTVTLSGVNTYTGGTTVSAGTLQISGSGTLGGTSGTLAVSGGTLDLGGTTQTTGALTLTGGTIQDGTLESSSFGVESGTISAVLAGSGALDKTGSGTVILSGDNTYTGGTTISAGTLELSGSGTLGASTGSLTITGGTLDLNGDSITVGLLTLSGGTIEDGSVTSTGGIASSGGSISGLGGTVALTVSTGTTTLSGSNSYTGDTVVESGALLAGAANTFSAASATTVSGGALDLGGYAQTINAVTLTGGSITDGTLTFTTLSAQSGSVSAVLAGAGSVSVTGTGTVTLSGANTYTGGTTVSAGTLQISGSGTLGATSGTLAVSGGVLDLGGTTQTTGALTLTGGTIQDGTLESSSFGVQDGTVSAVLAGSGALDKTSTGTVTLTADNTYTGGTTVSAGTLAITGSIVGGLTNDAYVNAQGSISGAIQNDSTGVFTVTGALTGDSTFTNDGTLAVGANSFTGVTTLTNSGSVTVGDGGVLTVSGGVTNSGSIVVSLGGTVNDDLANTGTVTNYGAYNATVDSNTGTITNASGGTWTGDVASNASGTVTNDGDWSGSATNTGGSIVNQSTWTGSIANNSGTLTNSGTISSGVTNAGTATNSGTIDGGVTNTGTFTNDAGATVNGGLTNSSAGTVYAAGTITGDIVNKGTFEVTGALTNTGGTFTSSSGTLEVESTGTLTATTLDVTGGVLELDSGAAVSIGTINISADATLEISGDSTGLSGATYDNTGALDIENGSATNVVTVGAYKGEAGSTLEIGVDFNTGTADKLVVASATGSTEIVVTDIAPNLPGVYDPSGIPVVVSSTSMSASAFTLEGGAIQKGLFQYVLAYNSDPEFLLVSTPSAAAYRLATVPTAAQSIWLDTSGVWLDRQSDLRDFLVEGAPAPGTKSADGAPAVTPGIWARAVGEWANRDETQSYSTFGKTYDFQTGYRQNIDGVYGGLDIGVENVASRGDALLFGATGGYVTSTQNFKDASATATFQGGSAGLSATYLTHGFFVDAMLKGDFLTLHYSDLADTMYGAGKLSASVVSLGAVVDTGYRFDLGGKTFAEPLATLAYVSTRIGDLSLAGSQIGFGSNDTLRGRIGVRGGATVVDTTAYRIDVSATASYWDRLTGGASTVIDSGSSAPSLTLLDKQAASYGEVGLGVNYSSLKTGWSGFVKGDYQFATGFNAGTIKGGVRYDF